MERCRAKDWTIRKRLKSIILCTFGSFGSIPAIRWISSFFFLHRKSQRSNPKHFRCYAALHQCSTFFLCQAVLVQRISEATWLCLASFLLLKKKKKKKEKKKKKGSKTVLFDIDVVCIFLIGDLQHFILTVDIQENPYSSEKLEGHFWKCMTLAEIGCCFARSGYYFLIVWFIFIQTAVRNKAAGRGLQFWAGANGSCAWKGFLVVQGSMFTSHGWFLFCLADLLP